MEKATLRDEQDLTSPALRSQLEGGFQSRPNRV
jgi:hypothetical protein